MGYTTEFSGKFDFDREIDADAVDRCNKFADYDYREADFPKGAPDAYLQWKVTNDRKHLEWDGNEKFYRYVEWLQWLIDHVFKPRGYALTGRVVYRGEDHDDVGTLEVVDGKVVQTPAVFK